MSKFDNHVILPVEEFTELQATDWLEERRVKRDDAKLDQLNNTKK